MTVQRWALLRKFLRSGDSYNREVADWFADNDNNEVRLQVRDLLLIGAKDSIQIAQVKMRSFREVVQKSHLKPAIVGISKERYDAEYKYKPEIVLYFLQNKNSLERNETPTDARISFRLLNESSETITITELQNWARKIQSSFFNPIFRFKKGKKIAWYVKPDDGFHLQTYVYDDAEGERVVKEIVQLAGKTWDENYFKVTDPRRSNTTTRSTVRILGKTRTEPKWRPTVFVEASYAYVNIHGEPNPVILVDQTGLQVNPLIRDGD